eukprot:scaffold76105_cov69-Attheya_sp.AAC.4
MVNTSSTVDGRAAGRSTDGPAQVSDGNNGAAAANKLGPAAAMRTGGGKVLIRARGKVFVRRDLGSTGARGQGGGKGARDPVPMVGRPPRRKKTGMAALAEIRAMQASVGLIIPKAAVSRLVREITQSVPGHKDPKSIQWTGPALAAIHEALEAYTVKLFERSNLVAIHGKHVTINPKDMHVIFNIREE